MWVLYFQQVGDLTQRKPNSLNIERYFQDYLQTWWQFGATWEKIEAWFFLFWSIFKQISFIKSGTILNFWQEDIFSRVRFRRDLFILGVEYFTKCVFSWIYFKVDFFKNLIKRTFCSTSRYLDGKEKPKKKKDKRDNKR